MEISEEKKLDVLMAQLQERYDALHKMRDRSMQFVLWILGFGLGLAWLLIHETFFTLSEKILISLLLCALWVTTLYFIWSIGKGFNDTRQIIIRLESSFKLYDKNYYDISDSILPTKYSSKKTGISGHFKTLNVLIMVVFLALMFLTWFSSCKTAFNTPTGPSEPNQVQIPDVNIINEV